MTNPAATALAEYLRRRERAVIDVANRQVDPARARRVLEDWLAIAILAGADHPDCADAMAPYRDAAGGAEPFTPAQARVAAASWLSPRARWSTELARVTAHACAIAEAGGQQPGQLKGTTTPAHPEQSRPQAEQSKGRAHAMLALARHLEPLFPSAAPSPLPQAGGAGGGPLPVQPKGKPHDRARA